MALTEHDKKNLSQSDQQKIQAATAKWNAANASGDKAGMAAAAAEAAAVRNNAGYKTDDSGNYTGSYTPTSSGGGSYSGSSGGSSKNSQYTGSSTSIKTYNTTQQSIKDKMNANSIAWWSADEEERRRLEEENKSLATLLGGSVSYDASSGTWSGAAEGTWEETYEEENQKPTAPEQDPRINELLNEILNRDDFSYDVMSDPLYQQYAAMYQREGDRAMKETMAEAAAGAGGMNTYAITAAQQANSYYNSQLNDKIPQLYQLAYEMYLNDKESKVQDLGILQNMDSTQYNRYRDTITDWYADKNFAYGVYQDDVYQNNWQTEMDNDNYWKNKEFDNSNYWANKEWNANREDKDFDRNQYDQESAKEEVWRLIELGVTPSAELIAAAGMSETDVKLAVESVKKQYAADGIIIGNGSSGTSSSGSSGTSGGTGSSGSSSSSSSSKTPSKNTESSTTEEKAGTDKDTSKDDMSDYTVSNTHGESWVAVSGLGRLTWQELATMVEKGTVIETVDKKNKSIIYRKA